jgi:hypothetical protein
MRAASSHPVEVYCNHCRVTFPTGSKRCIHCGGPLSRERWGASVELGPGAEEVLLEEEPVVRRSPFSPVTLVWIALLVGAYLTRMCAE